MPLRARFAMRQDHSWPSLHFHQTRLLELAITSVGFGSPLRSLFHSLAILGCVDDREAGHECARAGGRKGEPARGLQPRLPRRPGFPARFPGVPALPRAPWNRPIHVAAGQPMGQRARGIPLQDAQARAGERQGCKTREEAKQDVFKYIELYRNRRRMHSSIGYNAPCDLERGVA